MPRYLLDTNTVSFLVRQKPAAVVYRVRSLPRGSLLLSAVCEAEIRFGLALLPEDAKVRMPVEAFLQGIEIQPWDSRCASRYGLMLANQQRLGKLLATADAMIAAHALAYDFVLVTNDAAFLHVENLRVEDWTKGPEPA